MPQPAATRRTRHRLNLHHDYDLVDIFEGQTPGTIDDMCLDDTHRCTLHDRPFCSHCMYYGARQPGVIGVDPAKWYTGKKPERKAPRKPHASSS